jgi:TupA-like ATPgrasp
MSSPQAFSERIARRRALWWDPPWPGRGRGPRDAAHRLRERRALRGREDPDALWRCCERWPRTLMNKWNAREFAARHGADLPELYWRGSGPSLETLSAMPEDYVVRPVTGANKAGVSVVRGGREMLRGGSGSAEEIRAELPRTRLHRAPPVLLEEMITPDSEELTLPLEFKLYTFAGRVGLVERLERVAAEQRTHRFYLPDWEPVEDPINTYVEQSDPVAEPPNGLDEMLVLASAMSAGIGTFMRIDFFAAPRGPVFNEFSSVPLLGRHYTPAADELLGRLWREHCPDAV